MEYLVLKRLNHNHRQYEVGETISLKKEEEINPLVINGIISLKEMPPSEEKNEEQKEESKEESKKEEIDSSSEKKTLIAPEDSAGGMTPTGFCFGKCKQVRRITGAHEIMTKRNARALQGKCEACGTTITRILPKKRKNS